MRFFQSEFVSLYDLPCPVSLEEYTERTKMMRIALSSYAQKYGEHYELDEGWLEHWGREPLTVAQRWGVVKNNNRFICERLQKSFAIRARKWMFSCLGALTLAVLPVVIDRLL